MTAPLLTDYNNLLLSGLSDKIDVEILSEKKRADNYKASLNEIFRAHYIIFSKVANERRYFEEAVELLEATAATITLQNKTGH